MQSSENMPVGSLRISQDVIASVAKYAVREIEGVASLATAHTDLRGIFKKQMRRAIAIELNDNVAVIDLRVNLKYGVKIPQVCEAIQKAVKESVQNMTGIAVAKVNVEVAGIVIDTTSAPIEE